MTPALRSTRRSGWLAIVLFGIVYLSAFALVLAPGSLRAVAPGLAATHPASVATKGVP